MAIPLPDARELSDEVLEALRLRALRGCELGLTEATVADLLGVCRETVCHWWSDYSQGGLDALPHHRTGRPVGSGRLLSAPQADRIQQLLRAYRPEELGIAAPVWTRRAVLELIRKECSVSLALRTVGLYLQRWGFKDRRAIDANNTKNADEKGPSPKAEEQPGPDAWPDWRGPRLSTSPRPR
jgi:transposase